MTRVSTCTAFQHGTFPSADGPDSYPEGAVAVCDCGSMRWLFSVTPRGSYGWHVVWSHERTDYVALGYA